MADPYLGQIQMFGFNFAVRGWSLCNGQLIAISQNTALFSLLGTIYGGDGRSSFALPELRGRVPMHYGSGPGLGNYPIGVRGGVETVTLSPLEMPSHNHSTSAQHKVTSSTASTTDPSSAYHASTTGSTNIYNTSVGRGATSMAADAITITEQSQGGDQPHENRPPFLAVNFQIAMTGVFPSRS